MKTFYIVQGFTRQGSGKNSKLMGDTVLHCKNEHEALNRAERLAEKRVGVVAATQQYDEASGEYGEVKILVKYGELPDGMGGED